MEIKPLELRIPTNLYNHGVDVNGRYFFADSNDSANWQILRVPLPELPVEFVWEKAKTSFAKREKGYYVITLEARQKPLTIGYAEWHETALGWQNSGWYTEDNEFIDDEEDYKLLEVQDYNKHYLPIKAVFVKKIL